MAEASVIEAFFDAASLAGSLSVLCQNNKLSPTDPITHTLVSILSAPVQIQLTAVGVQPFQSKDLTIPYSMMSGAQRECLRRLVESHPEGWCVYEHAMVFRPPAGSAPQRLRTLDVLEALCAAILRSTTYPDRRLRVAVCNILLQRVQASVPLEKSVQAQLNARLFPAVPDGQDL